LERDLDRLKITVDPEYSEDGQDLGMDKIAFTSKPAIKVRGMAFNSQEKFLAFSDSVKMRIAAPALIPMDIYRNDEHGEYYVQFTEEEIEKIYVKFMSNLNNGNQNKFNIEHDNKTTVPAFVLESWLVGKKNLEDRSYSQFGVQVPPGTLFMVAQITDENYYNEIVSNDQIGFSIEGFLGLKLSETKNNEELSSVLNNIKMAEQLTLPEGEHEISGKIYVVKDGQVTEIKDKVEMAEEVVLEEVVLEEVIEEEVIEEKMEINVEPNAELAPNPGQEEIRMAIDETELMAIMQPKLDEIYGVIADLKAYIESEETPQEESTEVKMSAHQTFNEVMNFLNK
jgi:hypothetical protein